MENPDRNSSRLIFEQYRKQRDGIRNCPALASLCLICGSIHVVPKESAPGMLTCRNCGFSWYRYICAACGNTIDGRDPQNPGCRVCSRRICTCGKCDCPADTVQPIKRGNQ